MKEKDAIAKDKTYFTPSFTYAMHVYHRILYFGNFQTPNPMCMHRIIPKSWKARTARAQTMFWFGGQNRNMHVLCHIWSCICIRFGVRVEARKLPTVNRHGVSKQLHKRRCQIEFSLAMASFCFTISVILSYKITHQVIKWRIYTK